MADPGVSVIIPVRNGERFLAEAIESALRQTLPPLEVIVVDDGSTDATSEVARRYPVRLISQAHGGISAARNRGIAESRGEFLTFLDHDDIWADRKLERQIAPLVARPELAYTQCRLLAFLEPGTERPARLHEECFTEGFVPLAGCGVVRREAFERVGPFDPELAVGEDADWTLRAADAGLSMEVVDEPLTRYRIHRSNATHGLRAPAVLDVLRRSMARRRAG
jgi:glycosyltransferase involved in cell wall biosynthesis